MTAPFAIEFLKRTTKPKKRSDEIPRNKLKLVSFTFSNTKVTKKESYGCVTKRHFYYMVWAG